MFFKEYLRRYGQDPNCLKETTDPRPPSPVFDPPLCPLTTSSYIFVFYMSKLLRSEHPYP